MVTLLPYDAATAQLRAWGQNLKAQVVLSGRSCQEFAKQVNVSNTYLARVFSGHVVMSEDLKARVQKHLGPNVLKGGVFLSNGNGRNRKPRPNRQRVHANTN